MGVRSHVSPVIHLEEPSTAAVRPSAVIAHFAEVRRQLLFEQAQIRSVEGSGF